MQNSFSEQLHPGDNIKLLLFQNTHHANEKNPENNNQYSPIKKCRGNKNIIFAITEILFTESIRLQNLNNPPNRTVDKVIFPFQH